MKSPFLFALLCSLVFVSCGQWEMQYAEKDSDINLLEFNDSCFAYTLWMEDEPHDTELVLRTYISADSVLCHLHLFSLQVLICDSTGDSIGVLLPDNIYFEMPKTSYSSNEPNGTIDVRALSDSLHLRDSVWIHSTSTVTMYCPYPDTVGPAYLLIRIRTTTEKQGVEFSFARNFNVERKLIRFYSGTTGKLFCEHHKAAPEQKMCTPSHLHATYADAFTYSTSMVNSVAFSERKAD